MRVLVVDDEAALRESVARGLRFEGYSVVTAADGVEALDRLAESEPDVVVLDVMMPRLDGIEVCRRMRAGGDRTPVLVLTARHGVEDRVRGLDAGADDYLVKPFAYEELMARVRALVRRGGAEDRRRPLVVGDVQLDPQRWEVVRGDRPITLTRTEFHLLELLMRHPNQVLSRGQIYEGVWGCDLEGSSNSLDVYIGYLRRKLEAAGEPRLIQTVRGVGFAMRAGDTAR